MQTRRHRTSALGLAVILTLALLNAPSGYTRQGGPPQDSPPGKANGKDERNEAPDPCQQLVKSKGEARGLHDRCEGAGGGGGVSRGDFNGDGFGDLAIGVPGEDVGVDRSGAPLNDAGAVNVIYGSAAGLSAAAGPGDQFWTVARIRGEGGSSALSFGGTRFGTALAAGDFNGDGYSDLAVGAPFQPGLGFNLPKAGAVQVLYGSAAGLSAASSHSLRQGSELVDAAESGDRFGSVLNWGDFNRDGIGDLAVGVPDEDVGSVEDAGAVHVLYGSPNGLAGTTNRLWHQNSLGIVDAAEADDRFGSALAAGDFNGDLTRDLAVGAPFEDVGSINAAGAVHVLYGSPSEGLTSTGDQFWHQDSEGILDGAETADLFGFALAAGNFNGDPQDDLAVGVWGEDLGTSGSFLDAGLVNLIYGSAAGLTEAGDQLWTQNSNGIHDVAESGDRFGSALAAGDFNGDGLKDLAVGVPFEDVGDAVDAGAVHVIYGSSEGLDARVLAPPPDATSPLFLDQGAATGGLNFPEVGDQFGSALTAWDFGFAPGVADLAVGVLYEDLGDIINAGAVSVIYGVNTAGQGTGAFANPQHWTQDSEGIEDQAEEGDEFGSAVY